MPVDQALADRAFGGSSSRIASSNEVQLDDGLYAVTIIGCDTPYINDLGRYCKKADAAEQRAEFYVSIDGSDIVLKFDPPIRFGDRTKYSLFVTAVAGITDIDLQKRFVPESLIGFKGQAQLKCVLNYAKKATAKRNIGDPYYWTSVETILPNARKTPPLPNGAARLPQPIGNGHAPVTPAPLSNGHATAPAPTAPAAQRPPTAARPPQPVGGGNGQGVTPANQFGKPPAPPAPVTPVYFTGKASTDRYPGTTRPAEYVDGRLVHQHEAEWRTHEDGGGEPFNGDYDWVTHDLMGNPFKERRLLKQTAPEHLLLESAEMADSMPPGDDIPY